MSNPLEFNETNTEYSEPQRSEEASLTEVYSTIRNGMKQQLKTLREIHNLFDSRSIEILERVGNIRAQDLSIGDQEARQMAISIAEIEESLHRALIAIPNQIAAHEQSLREIVAESESLATAVESTLSQPTGWKGWFSQSLTKSLTSLCSQSKSAQRDRIEKVLESNPMHNIARGLELLLERVRRLASEHGIERVDVLRTPFDPDRMRATDAVSSADIPSGHVVEQIRPLYLWKNQVLSIAEVRIAR
ncbi:nucleotide exchange factor GrpE [Pirellulaceae bacterium SH449]